MSESYTAEEVSAEAGFVRESFNLLATGAMLDDFAEMLAQRAAERQEPVARVDGLTGDLLGMRIITWLADQPAAGTLLYAHQAPDLTGFLAIFPNGPVEAAETIKYFKAELAELRAKTVPGTVSVPKGDGE